MWTTSKPKNINWTYVSNESTVVWNQFGWHRNSWALCDYWWSHYFSTVLFSLKTISTLFIGEQCTSKIDHQLNSVDLMCHANTGFLCSNPDLHLQKMWRKFPKRLHVKYKSDNVTVLHLSTIKNKIGCEKSNETICAFAIGASKLLGSYPSQIWEKWIVYDLAVNPLVWTEQ